MSRTDLSYINYGLPEAAFNWILEQNEARIKSHPTCEICKEQLSTRVTGLGTVKACCNDCNEEIYRRIDEDIELSNKISEEYYGM